ncbi:MAG: tRNA threonylcarbamoyladenosine dehydratase [Clostridia bacterium]|nr:tRNA threonylcarbamoyladenosine dehydratase [Clostridia bacterium]
MPDIFSRTELLLGKEAMEKLASSRVAVFGVGGVGGFTVEALARSGVGAIDIIDNDVVSLTNINRQIIATHKTVGKFKVDVAAERIAEINPDCKVTTYKIFYMPDTQGEIDFAKFDYIVDAIDTVTGKLTIIENAEKCGVPVISCMGAGNKLDPTAFEVADVYKTSVCPLAKVMRRELKKRGIKKLKVVYSKEEPIAPVGENTETGAKRIPGSTAFVPSVAGLIIAGEVIKDLINVK